MSVSSLDSSVIASTVASAAAEDQYSMLAMKKALNTEKQEGANALALINSADLHSTPRETGVGENVNIKA